jgi:hypothetical protein
LGYNFTLNYASQGAASFYATLPAQVSNQTQINTDYAPIIKKGTAIRSIDGDSFILTEASRELINSDLTFALILDVVFLSPGRILLQLLIDRSKLVII